MANGDAALADGMAILAGTDPRRNGWDEINKSRDYIAGRARKAHTHPRADITDLPPLASADNAVANAIPVYNAARQLTTADPTASGHAASKGYVDAHAGQLQDGGTFLQANGKNLGTTGDLYASGTVIVYGATPAVSGWTQAYIDGNGKLAKGASSARYKKFMSAIDPATLGDVWPQLTRYQMRQGDGTWKYGYIAEDLDGNDDQRAFVVYNNQGEPDSIDFNMLLMVQNAQLHQAVELLTQRIERLEGRA